MPSSLKLYIGVVATASMIALALATLMIPVDPKIGIGHGPYAVELGLGFWTILTAAAWALPVRLARGSWVAVSTAPIIAAMSLGGPAAAGWVALIGALEIRELRGEIPWYGTVANHAGLVLPAVLGGLVAQAVGRGSADLSLNLAATLAGALVHYSLNISLTSAAIALRTQKGFRSVLVGVTRGVALTQAALAPLAWLMATVFSVAWWATLLFGLPLYTTRVANRQLGEMREMFTQTISSLAQAVDKRDPFTSNHSRNVMLIASDIGRIMKVNDQDMEALEWGGLLHDVGKIGVPDNILLKQEKLTREERMRMNSHPELGAQIIAPVTKLAPELPIIRHHHEWFNGSGYPDRLMGDEIPKLARVLHVADAFEAMTAARPYRMKPLSAEQALGELRKFAGIQFDPEVVDAFVKTKWADGVSDPGRAIQPRPVPLLAQAAAGRMATSTAVPQGTAAAIPGDSV